MIKQKCPECSKLLECVHVYLDAKNNPSKVERLYKCNYCGSSWLRINNDELERYFVG